MSSLTELIAQAKAKDPQLGADLEREIQALSARRAFGLNFERHRPEAVELPQRPVRRGDKVRVLPARGTTAKGDQRVWSVRSLATVDEARVARLESLRGRNRKPKPSPWTIWWWSPSSATPSIPAWSAPGASSAAATSHSTPSSTPRTTSPSRP